MGISYRDIYELPSGDVKIAIDNGPFIVIYPLKMVIFHSYVTLTEGICLLICVLCVFFLERFLESVKIIQDCFIT
jgi:hypothetical protein